MIVLAKEKETKTNVMRILDQKKIPYQVHHYAHGEGAVDGASVAAMLGQNPAQVFKTLVTRGPGGFFVFVVPVEKELDLKAAARAAGEKSVEMIHVKELTPVLSVQTVEEVTYTQSIPCPVEEVEDSSMYVGETRTITQGVEGQEEVNATVTYVNGQETERTVNSTTTLQEPTTTVKAVGTKEKPRTASSGSYQWPIYGRITSYFGGRYIFGSYSYHSGIDISASYGAAVCAADGGTVTYAGYRGSYGNLVVTPHDNGTQTYYGHNSSLTVSVGDKVYKGQQIARAGSTGRSTGVHCHFEIRVNGTSVNPLSYLP